MPKLPYWLDANIFIEANNTFFSIEIAPSFWAWLETQLKAGVLKSSSLVYGEVLGKDDKLAKWARVRKGDAYWPEPDGEVQAAYREVSDYVDVLAQREMEKRRSPLVWIPPLRGGDFQGMGVYRPMTVSMQCTARENKLPRCCASAR